MRVLFIVLLALCAIANKGFSQNKTGAQMPADLDSVSWLLGSWEQKTARGIMVETWRRNTDSSYAGESYLVTDKDTIPAETVDLVKENGIIFYIPTVKRQNEGKPVRFRLVSFSSAQMRFENLQHDFPQVITYTMKDKDNIVAEISGTVNGSTRSRQFPMQRRMMK